MSLESNDLGRGGGIKGGKGVERGKGVRKEVEEKGEKIKGRQEAREIRESRG